MIKIDLRFYRGIYQGGVFKICIAQIKALLKNKNRVLLIVDSSRREKEFRKVFQNSKYLEIRVKKIWISYTIDTLFLAGFINTGNYKIHYWPWYIKPIINLFAKKEILGLWDITPITFPSAYKKKTALILNFGIRLSTKGNVKILSCSKFDCLEIERILKPTNSPIYVPLILDNTDFYNKILSLRKKEKFEFKHSKKELTFISYGTIYDRREIPFILKSIEYLQSTKKIKCKLFLIGQDATSLGNIDSLCKKSKLSIVRKKYINEKKLEEFICLSDYGICLSTQDGTSYILIEYALMGVPVITTNLMSLEIDNKCIALSENLDKREFITKILNDLKEEKIKKTKKLNDAKNFVLRNFPNLDHIDISYFFEKKN